MAIDDELNALGLGGLLRGDSSALHPLHGAGEQAGAPAVMTSPRGRWTTGEMTGLTLDAAEALAGVGGVGRWTSTGEVAGDQTLLLSPTAPARVGSRPRRQRRTSEVMVQEWTLNAKRRASTVLVGPRVWILGCRSWGVDLGV